MTARCSARRWCSACRAAGRGTGSTFACTATQGSWAAGRRLAAELRAAPGCAPLGPLPRPVPPTAHTVGLMPLRRQNMPAPQVELEVHCVPRLQLHLSGAERAPGTTQRLSPWLSPRGTCCGLLPLQASRLRPAAYSFSVQTTHQSEQPPAAMLPPAAVDAVKLKRSGKLQHFQQLSQKPLARPNGTVLQKKALHWQGVSSWRWPPRSGVQLRRGVRSGRGGQCDQPSCRPPARAARGARAVRMQVAGALSGCGAGQQGLRGANCLWALQRHTAGSPPCWARPSQAGGAVQASAPAGRPTSAMSPARIAAPALRILGCAVMPLHHWGPRGVLESGLSLRARQQVSVPSLFSPQFSSIPPCPQRVLPKASQAKHAHQHSLTQRLRSASATRRFSLSCGLACFRRRIVGV
jgi:hypothetical protein